MNVLTEKTLSDVVKGIRATKRDTGLYISQCIAETKNEVRSSDQYTKANALEKLTFLQMMGYDMGWASFAAVEIMSSPRFAHKHIGYLAGCQGFSEQNSDEILLTTNLLKKELRGASSFGSSGVYEAGLAINFVANVVTEDLARELLPELTQLTRHPHPYLRKKAVLCLFRIFVKYPQGLRLTFERIQQSLDDTDAAVVSCAVNVITELSDKNPKNYLVLAPQFFQLLTNSSNNWMLIKVVKLLGSLVSEEPRLARKLLEPLATIVRKTQAKSLLYEAVLTITLALPYCRKADGSMPSNVPDIVDLCASTLKSFIVEDDLNLKYLGLVGFNSLMVSHPKVLSSSEYKDLILACLSDEDVTLRSRALDLLTGLAGKKNLRELITQLLRHVELADGAYKLDLVDKIIFMCSRDKYAHLSDNFSWYISTVLVILAHVQGIEVHGALISSQIADVALRVLPVRKCAVKSMVNLLFEEYARHNGVNSDQPSVNGQCVMKDVLPSVAWVIGEYSQFISKIVGDADIMNLPKGTSDLHCGIIKVLLDPSSSLLLDGNTQSIYVGCAMKVFASACNSNSVSTIDLGKCLSILRLYLPLFMESILAEVQERACSAYNILTALDLFTQSEDEMSASESGLYSSSQVRGVQNPTNDLLGFGMSSDHLSSAKIQQKSSTAVLNQSKTSLISKCQSAAATLGAFLVPEAMKPIGTKQQKRLAAPMQVDHDNGELQTLFDTLFADEISLIKTTNNVTVGIEEVSFTQQKVTRPTVKNNVPGVSIVMDSSVDKQSQPFESFQNSSAHIPSALNGVNNGENRQFYLNSSVPSASPAGADENKKADMSVGGAGRFGAIQLLDDGGFSDDDDKGKHSGKKGKKKRGKKKNSSSSRSVRSGKSGIGSNMVYDSDDNTEKGPKTRVGKEFAGLAMVDLTAPLRKDEVIRERTHRQVPDKRLERPKKENKSKKALKSKKKSKVKKGASSVSKEIISEPVTNDLLDLGVFSPSPSVNHPSTTASNMFDPMNDLLAPDLTNTVGLLDMSSSNQVTTVNSSSSRTKSKKDGWLKGKIAHTPGCEIFCEGVIVQYRISPSKTKSNKKSVLASVRLTNQTGSVLENAKIALSDQSSSFGVIPPNQIAENSSKLKLGPFTFDDEPQVPIEINGFLSDSKNSVPLKIMIPVSIFFTSVPNLTDENVIEELGNGMWSSQSIKLSILSTAQSDVISVLQRFLRAELVGGCNGGILAATLATMTNNGTQLRLLCKVKKSVVKIDLKCSGNNDKLGKLVASDLKRLIL